MRGLAHTFIPLSSSSLASVSLTVRWLLLSNRERPKRPGRQCGYIQKLFLFVYLEKLVPVLRARQSRVPAGGGDQINYLNRGVGVQGSGQIGGLLTMTRAKTPYLPTYPQAAQRSEKRRKIGGTYLLQGPLAWGGVVKTGPTYCIGCLAQTPYLARSRNPVYTPRSPGWVPGLLPG